MRALISKKELKRARESITQIALKEGISEEQVRKDMLEAMQAGMSNPDPQIQSLWKTIPCKGDTPTPEEFIAWAAKRVRKGVAPSDRITLL